MCAGADCDTPLINKTIPANPAVPGSKAVVLGICPRCDRRMCQACKSYIADPKARRCNHCGCYL